MGRFSGITLELRGLGNIATLIGTYTDTIISASGTQVLNGVGQGRFSFSARDNTLMSAIDTGQVAYCYVTDEVVGSGSEMDLALFIIEKIVTTTQPGGSIVTVSGPSVLHQLTYETLDDDAIDNGTGGVDTSDITNIMAYAPSGWSLVGNSATTNGTYHLSRGDNVLKMLIEAAKQSGEMFRLDDYSGTPSKEVRWQATEDASGVTLRMPADPTDYDGSTTVGIILSLTEDKDFTPVVTRIRPYGAGLGVGRVSITGIDATDTGGDPAWMTTTFASNLMVNTTLETSLGFNVKQDVDFSHIRPADPEDATQATTAAVALWNTGKNYLESRDSSRVFYRVRCVVPEDLRPGQTVTVVYDEYEGGQTGGSQVISINTAFTIHEVTNSVDPSTGYRVTDLLLGDSLVPRPTGPSVVANSLRTTQDTTRKADAGLGANTVPDSRLINTDNPIKIDGVNSADLTADRTISLGSLTTFGTANDVIGINAAATDVEYKDILAGTGISITHAAGSITVTNTGTTADITGEPFLVTGLTAGLSNERALTTGNGIDFTDGGANAAFNIFVDLATNSGMTFSTAQLTLGTPSTVTSTSTNSVTTTTHSHAVDSTIALAADLHDAVTLATDVDNALLGLTGQEIFLDNQAANLVFAGPASGPTTNPGFRALVEADLPTGQTITLSTTNTGTSHAITTSSDPTNAQILASDGFGRLGLEGLGIGTTADSDNIKIASGVWYGLSSGAGRITITNAATDTIVVEGGDFYAVDNAVIGHNAFVATGSHTGRKIEFRGSNPLISVIDAASDNHPVLQFEGSGGHDNMAIYFDSYYNGTNNLSSDLGSNYRLAKLNDDFILQFNSGTAAGSSISSWDTGWLMDTNGTLFLNESVNTDMTIGLTINQGANDNEALAVKSSDVAHGITADAETDTYFMIRKVSPANGGARLRGYTEATLGIEVTGQGVTDNTTKSTTGVGFVELRGMKSNGNPGANANLVAIRSNATTRWIVDSVGDTHRDGTDNTYDAFDDVSLCRAFDLATSPGTVIETEFDNFLTHNKADLLDVGILHESGFYNESKLLRLHNGAIWQLHQRIAELEDKLNGI